jgi:antitoxin CcdA
MPNTLPPRETRRPTNVTLPQALLDQARALNINISAACEAGLAAEVKAAAAAKFLEENASAIDYWNARMEDEGLLLSEYRLL